MTYSHRYYIGEAPRGWTVIDDEGDGEAVWFPTHAEAQLAADELNTPECAVCDLWDMAHPAGCQRPQPVALDSGELIDEHETGAHDDMCVDCPSCQREMAELGFHITRDDNDVVTGVYVN